MRISCRRDAVKWELTPSDDSVLSLPNLGKTLRTFRIIWGGLFNVKNCKVKNIGK